LSNLSVVANKWNHLVLDFELGFLPIIYEVDLIRADDLPEVLKRKYPHREVFGKLVGG